MSSLLGGSRADFAACCGPTGAHPNPSWVRHKRRAAILLLEYVAAIALTLREKRESKSINPSEQVIVRKEDRLRMVNMKSETEPKPDESNTKGEAS